MSTLWMLVRKSLWQHRFSTAVTIVAAALGAGLTLRRRDLSPLLTGSWLALHAGMVLFLVADRYRLSTWPMMCLLGALGAAGLAEHVQARRWPPRSWAVALVFVALPWWPIDWITAKQPGWCAHQRGNFALQDGDYDQAIASQPESANFYFNRAMVQEALGDLDKAKDDMTRFLELTDNADHQDLAHTILARWEDPSLMEEEQG